MKRYNIIQFKIKGGTATMYFSFACNTRIHTVMPAFERKQELKMCVMKCISCE